MSVGLRDFVKTWGPTITVAVLCCGFFLELSAKIAEVGSSYVAEIHSAKNTAVQTAKDFAAYKTEQQEAKDKQDIKDANQDKDIDHLKYDVTRLLTTNRMAYIPPAKTE
jgi:hypothetical protein